MYMYVYENCKALTYHQGQEGPDLPSLRWRDLNINIDIEAWLEGGGAEGREGREVIGSFNGPKTLKVLFTCLKLPLSTSNFLIGRKQNRIRCEARE